MVPDESRRDPASLRKVRSSAAAEDAAVPGHDQEALIREIQYLIAENAVLKEALAVGRTVS